MARDVSWPCPSGSRVACHFACPARAPRLITLHASMNNDAGMLPLPKHARVVTFARDGSVLLLCLVHDSQGHPQLLDGIDGVEGRLLAVLRRGQAVELGLGGGQLLGTVGKIDVGSLLALGGVLVLVRLQAVAVQLLLQLADRLIDLVAGLDAMALVDGV